MFGFGSEGSSRCHLVSLMLVVLHGSLAACARPLEAGSGSLPQWAPTNGWVWSSWDAPFNLEVLLYKALWRPFLVGGGGGCYSLLSAFDAPWRGAAHKRSSFSNGFVQ